MTETATQRARRCRTGLCQFAVVAVGGNLTPIMYRSIAVVSRRISMFIFLSPPSLSSLTPRQSSYEQAVVTGVVPSPPRYVPSFLLRIGFSIPTARRFPSNVASSRFRALR